MVFFTPRPYFLLELYPFIFFNTTPENSLPILQEAREALAQVDDFSNDALYEALCALAERLEVKNGRVLWPVRVAISGTAVTPGGATELAEILGKEETLRRMDQSIQKLQAAL